MPTKSKTARPTKKPASKPASKPVKPVKASVKEDDKPKVYFAPPGPKLGDEPTNPVVNAKCRRGQDRQTEGQSCKSLMAENMTAPGSNTVRFRCVACKYAWNVPMGGAFQGA